MIGYASDVDPDALPAALKTLHDFYVARSGSVPGPFRIWMHNERVAQGMKAYSDFAIRGSALSELEREIVILRCAVACGSGYVLAAHKRNAARAGMTAGEIEAVCDGEDQAFSDRRSQAVYLVARQMSAHRLGTSRAYAAGVAEIGLPLICEIAALYGFYAACSATLNFCGAEAPGG
jgi:alkylhydroperoxidase family enzyme